MIWAQKDIGIIRRNLKPSLLFLRFMMIRYFIPLLLLATQTTFCAAEDPPERQQIMQLLAAGQNVQALAAAREWTTAHPDMPEALLTYAEVQQVNDDFGGALDSLDSVYFMTRDAMVLVRKGDVYLEMGHHDQAEREYLEALRQQDGCVAAHVGLASVMMARQRPLEAGAALQAALTIEPDSVPALLAVAKLRLQAHEPDQAREVLQQALGKEPDTAAAHLMLGQIAAEAGDMAQAREHWRKFGALDPSSSAQWQLAHNFYPVRNRPFNCSGFYPAFAPDGKRFAFRGRGDATCLYISTLEHPEVTERLFQGPGTIQSLQWSPDGKYILCRDYLQKEEQGKPVYTYRLLVVPVPEGAVQQPSEGRLVYEGRYIGSPCWLPDSRGILFDGYVTGKGRPLLRVPIEPPAQGGQPAEPEVALTPTREESLSGCMTIPGEPMPPGGGLPKFLIHRFHTPSREYQVVLVNPADRTQDQVLVHSDQSLYYTGVSPDGKTLLYFRRTGQPPAWSLVAKTISEEGPGRALPFRTTMPMPPALTADNRHLVLYDRDGLYMVDLVGVEE